MTPVTKIYLIGFFTSITNQKCLLHQFIFIIFNTWSSLSQMESTVKISINTAVFRIGYFENELGDPRIFLPLWPELVIT